MMTEQHQAKVETQPKVATAMFTDRTDAGTRLGAYLQDSDWPDPVVLGLARGGVVVADRVAAALGAELDVAVARKIGAPGQPEFGVGAVTADGPARYDDTTLAALRLTREDLRADCERERAEAARRIRRYREVAAPVPIAGRDALLVDDGLATGVTARAALGQLRAARPRRLVFAVPVCARDSRDALCAEGDADDVICMTAPEIFGGVGAWYRDFTQTTDDDVLTLLTAHRRTEEGRRTTGRSTAS
jgi:putative phosphoribosyl transferase